MTERPVLEWPRGMMQEDQQQALLSSAEGTLGPGHGSCRSEVTGAAGGRDSRQPRWPGSKPMLFEPCFHRSLYVMRHFLTTSLAKAETTSS